MVDVISLFPCPKCDVFPVKKLTYNTYNFYCPKCKMKGKTSTVVPTAAQKWNYKVQEVQNNANIKN